MIKSSVRQYHTRTATLPRLAPYATFSDFAVTRYLLSGLKGAGVDLDELGKDEVEVEGEKVTIDLPAARILGSSLDEDKTKLYDRDLGLLRVRGDDALIEEARQDAIDRIEATAQENGITEQGDNNAEDRLSVASR